MPNRHSNSTFDLFVPTLTSLLCFLLMASIYYSVAYTVWENYLSMIIITTKQSKQHGSKSTNYNLQTWPFEPAEKKPMFPERSVRVSTEGENENVRHIFDLREHVIAKCGNGSKEIAGRWQNNVQLVSDICLPCRH